MIPSFRRRLGMFTVCSVMAAAFSGICGQAAAQPTMASEMLRSWKASSAELSGVVDKVNLTDSRKQELKQFLASPPADLDEVGALRFLAAAFDLGVAPPTGRGPSGWIEQPAVTRLLAASLFSPNAEVRNSAGHYLANYARDSDLRKNSEKIVNAVGTHVIDGGPRLIGRLGLGAEDAAKALAGYPTVPVEVSARLGDAAALDGLMTRFSQARSYDDKRDLAQRLGYVGGDRAGTALVATLGSDLFSGGPYERRSIRADLVAALGKIYQEEPLLNRDLLAAIARTDAEWAQTVKYVQAVTAWAKAHYQVDVTVATDPQSPAPLIFKRFVIERPIGSSLKK